MRIMACVAICVYISEGYGGWREICVSPYLHVAVVLAILTPGIWTRQGWWDIPLGVLPNVIGFTLGGYAILIAFGDERFKALLTTPSDQHLVSAFLAINATFVHFLLTAYPPASGATECCDGRSRSVIEQITNITAFGGPDDRFSPFLDRVPAALLG